MAKIKLETTWLEFDDSFATDRYGFKAYDENDKTFYESEYDWTMLGSAKSAAFYWAKENGHEILNENDVRLYGVCIALENEKA